MSFRQALLAVVGALVVSLALAVPASGQQTSVTDDQYADTVVQVGQGGNDPSDPSASDPSSVGSLPFTGLDLGLMAAAAAGLVAGGIVLRRRSADSGEHGA